MKNRCKGNLPALVFLAVLLFAWQLGAMKADAAYIIPSPVQILVRLWELREPLFTAHLPATMLCTGVGLAILYMGFSAFQIGGFSPARMLAFYCLLLCGCCLSTGAGCAAAIAAELVAALAGQPQLLAVYCASGLAAGVFAPLGRVGSCVSMSAGAVLALLSQRPQSPAAVLLAL